VITYRSHNLTELLNDVTILPEMQAITTLKQNPQEKYLVEFTRVSEPPREGG
jgi:hypothetical protein